MNAEAFPVEAAFATYGAVCLCVVVLFVVVGIALAVIDAVKAIRRRVAARRFAREIRASARDSEHMGMVVFDMVADTAAFENSMRLVRAAVGDSDADRDWSIVVYYPADPPVLEPGQ